MLIGPAKHASPAARPFPFAFAHAFRFCQLVERVIDLLVGLSRRNRNLPSHAISRHAFVARSRTAAVMDDKVHGPEPPGFGCEVEVFAEQHEAAPIENCGRHTGNVPRQRPTMDEG